MHLMWSNRVHRGDHADPLRLFRRRHALPGHRAGFAPDPQHPAQFGWHRYFAGALDLAPALYTRCGPDWVAGAGLREPRQSLSGETSPSLPPRRCEGGIVLTVRVAATYAPAPHQE